MTGDAQWMLDELRHGPATTSELIDRSKAERGVRLTPHSRVSDLRKRGHVIRVERLPGNGRRATYQYTLVKDAGAVEPPARVRQAPQPLIPQAVALPDAAIPGQMSLSDAIGEMLEVGERMLAATERRGP